MKDPNDAIADEIIEILARRRPELVGRSYKEVKAALAEEIGPPKDDGSGKKLRGRYKA